MSKQNRIIIIGGGVIGLSVAYHLAHRGEKNIVLLERNQLTSGTTWHAAGIVGPLRPTYAMTKIAIQTMSLFPALEEETGLKTGYQKTSGYWIARQDDRMDEIERLFALAEVSGLNAELLSGQEVANRVLNIDPSGIVGAMSLQEDSQVNPVDLCMAYARGATRLGVDIREGVTVDEILVESGRTKGVRLADGTEILGDKVALCAGTWSKKLTDEIGVALPLQAVKHMYVVTEPIPNLPKPYPIFRDMETNVYLKGDAGKMLIGWFEDDAKLWDPFGPEGDRPFLEMADDWDHAEPFLSAAMEMVPELEKTGISHFLNGPESFSHDFKPFVGETPEVDNLFIATAMNSGGILSSAGVGKSMAEWMTVGRALDDIWNLDIRRIDPKMSDPGFMGERMKEVVGYNFCMHWPYKQPTAGRNLRLSPLHDRLKDAQFGVGGAWERTLWFPKDDGERDLPYSVGEQHWQPIANREAQDMARDVSLIDLSPFTKINIAGPDALKLAQTVFCSNMDVAFGRAVYTLMLNEDGGIEIDLTVTRTGENSFRMTSPAATRRKDLAWITKKAADLDASIEDVTETEAVIGVMGPRSRALLAAISDADWDDFPFSTSRNVVVADIPVTATRISFVGELGWELSVPVANAGTLFDVLRAQGAGLMGTHAIDGCRLEKRFLHWGHDIDSNMTPLESGLGFTVDFKKSDFIGKAALEGQKKIGITRRLVLLEAEGTPLLLHEEPIYEDGAFVGLTTSGAVGPRTGKRLALGLIDIATGETPSQTATRVFDIQVGKKRYAANVITAPYDPNSLKMRG